MEMIGVDENDNKPELEDASHDYVDDFNDVTQDKVETFNEDTCNVCAYDFLTLQHLLTHNHSHDNINNYNDDKTVYVENEVESDNDIENMLDESLDITLVRVMSIVLMLTRFLC